MVKKINLPQLFMHQVECKYWKGNSVVDLFYIVILFSPLKNFGTLGKFFSRHIILSFIGLSLSPWVIISLTEQQSECLFGPPLTFP